MSSRRRPATSARVSSKDRGERLVLHSESPLQGARMYPQSITRLCDRQPTIVRVRLDQLIDRARGGFGRCGRPEKRFLGLRTPPASLLRQREHGSRNRETGAGLIETGPCGKRLDRPDPIGSRARGTPDLRRRPFGVDEPDDLQHPHQEAELRLPFTWLVLRENRTEKRTSPLRHGVRSRVAVDDSERANRWKSWMVLSSVGAPDRAWPTAPRSDKARGAITVRVRFGEPVRIAANSRKRQIAAVGTSFLGSSRQVTGRPARWNRGCNGSPWSARKVATGKDVATGGQIHGVH